MICPNVSWLYSGSNPSVPYKKILGISISTYISRLWYINPIPAKCDFLFSYFSHRYATPKKHQTTKFWWRPDFVAHIDNIHGPDRLGLSEARGALWESGKSVTALRRTTHPQLLTIHATSNSARWVVGDTQCAVDRSGDIQPLPQAKVSVHWGRRLCSFKSAAWGNCLFWPTYKGVRETVSECTSWSST
jgi:hypothetical protein